MVIFEEYGDFETTYVNKHGINSFSLMFVLIFETLLKKAHLFVCSSLTPQKYNTMGFKIPTCFKTLLILSTLPSFLII